MCTRARPYGRARQCDFGGQGVTNGIRAVSTVGRKPSSYWSFLKASFVLQSILPYP
jgi:hypothetical protein